MSQFVVQQNRAEAMAYMLENVLENDHLVAAPRSLPSGLARSLFLL
jgi:hypothetical protein